MNLLAIDTATPVLSVALSAGSDIWSFEAGAGLRHSELIMDSIDMLVKKAGLLPADLSAVTCMAGPGSFTGLRIGFSIAKGLALSLGIPFVPLPTLDCMARPFAMWPGIVVPVIDAKKNAFFCALYRDGERLTPPMDAEPARIARTLAAALPPESCPVLLTGPGAEQLRPLLPPEFTAALPPAAIRIAAGPAGGYGRILLDLYRQRIAHNPEIVHNKDSVEGCFSGPEYIRKSDAELNIK